MKRIFIFLLSILMIVSIFSITVSAVASPIPIEYHSITVGTQGKGQVEINKSAVQKNSDEIVMFIAKETENSFIKWELTGTYEIVNGDLTSKALRIKPSSDIVAIGIFEGGELQKPIIIEKSPISPKTGQNPYIIYGVLGLMVISAGLIFICRYKIKKDN